MEANYYQSQTKRKLGTLLFLLLIFINNALIKAQNPNPILRLTMTKPNFTDETVFYFQTGGDTIWQANYDAYKLVGPTTTAWIAGVKGNAITSISGLPALPINLNIPIKAKTLVSSTFSFSVVQENFPEAICVSLFDTYTQQSINLLTEQYVCQLYDTTTIARFRFKIYTRQGAGIVAQTPASCANPHSASIKAQGNGAGPWNYEWYFQDSLILQNIASVTADSIFNLDAGTYNVKINEVGTCLFFEQQLQVLPIIYPQSKFELNKDEILLSETQNLEIHNLSANAQSYSWNFGDSTTLCLVESPEHFYSRPGTFTISLKSKSSSECVDSTVSVVKVIDDTPDLTGLDKYANSEKALGLNYHNGQYFINYGETNTRALTVEVCDLEGRQILKQKMEANPNSSIPLNFNAEPNHLYLISASGSDFKKVFKVSQ